MEQQLQGKKSFVRACQDFFSGGKYGKKVSIQEFKALTEQDKVDLSVMLNSAGYDHTPYVAKTAT
jgi:hypothetical protein